MKKGRMGGREKKRKEGLLMGSEKNSHFFDRFQEVNTALTTKLSHVKYSSISMISLKNSNRETTEFLSLEYIMVKNLISCFMSITVV
jgi:hypothetical protein